jgi:hypothetical protein
LTGKFFKVSVAGTDSNHSVLAQCTACGAMIRGHITLPQLPTSCPT